MAKVIKSFGGFIGIEKDIERAVAKSLVVWQTEAPPKVIANIRRTVAAGNSPVEGQKRFVGYSRGYTRQIKTPSFKKKYPNKTIRPVNLYLSGDMMGSLNWGKKSNGYVVFFTNPLAKIHSTVGPRGRTDKIRKIMPQGLERFKKSVTFESDEMIVNLLTKNLKRPFKE